ncbi:nucleoside-specific channel-forming protein Tsx [Salmonella enterica]|nr:nucleoside-specific channel-forming protein Tsx [Salmonella enterica]EBN0364685.1 nucleoside-specific channel-forming protein Tsx [Salmonella enterica subsp. enterica serovar Infantis]EAZ0791465.1 nucleoside-specific channel-forming protein Tsx [Salmonella enterica]EBA7583121.1 nucleoside-specific channel-forming protein Tsx [Salmonella enterica]EBB9435280.1 nucleoside-specific channel-forming protein Tsx [Salmonella enterica]
MKKSELGKLLCIKGMLLVSSAALAESNEYLSSWWHQSVNVVGAYNTKFGPQPNNDVYLEYEVYSKNSWLDFYGYADIPKTFGIGNSNDRGVWDKGSPFFTEIEPRFSFSGMSGLDLSSFLFKDWYFANNYIFDLGRNNASRQSTWYMGLGTDVDTHSPLYLQLNIYKKYQFQNYGAANANSWDGYRFKVKYIYPITDILGGTLSYIGYTNFDFGSHLGDDSAPGTRTNNAITSSHIISLAYKHFHYGLVARYWHNGGQWRDGAGLDFGDGMFSAESNGWGYYAVIGYNF